MRRLCGTRALHRRTHEENFVSPEQGLRLQIWHRHQTARGCLVRLERIVRAKSGGEAVAGGETCLHVLDVFDGVVGARAIQLRVLQCPAAGPVRKSAGIVRIGRFQADAELVERFNAGASGGTDVSFVAVAIQGALLIIRIEWAEKELLVLVPVP